MECTLVVPHGTDISKIEAEYPDICNDGMDEEGDVYFIGKPSDACEADEDMDGEWLEYDEAIEFCGFCEGAIEGADAVIDGNGPWAMGMLCRRDFSGYSATESEIAEWKRRSNIWWAAYDRGKLSR